MNTRLQVEHAVTELVLGRDLVADQLAIAAGATLEELGLDQTSVDRAFVAGGHAVEVRLYAEDAEAGFLPATGRVERIRWPAESTAFGPIGPAGVRVDAGIEAGTQVGTAFDPMLAKMIAHGSDRAAALERLVHALDEIVVLGLVTNLRFLRWLVRQPVVRAGQVRVDTLPRIWPPDDWAARMTLDDATWQVAAGSLAGARPDLWAGGWRLNAPSRLRLATDGDERSVEVRGVPTDGPERVLVGDTVHVDAAGRSVAFRLAPPPDVDRAAELAASHAQPGTADVAAAMPGTVFAVHVAAGDRVEAGNPLVTLEAMKMEHVVVAPGPGTVANVAVEPGQQVTRGQALATLRH